MRKRIIRVFLLICVTSALIYFSGGLNFLTESSTAYAVGDLTVDWGVAEGQPIFTIAGMAPGDSESRDVTVTNNAPTSRPVGIRSVTTNDPDNLSSVMEIVISDGGGDLYGGTLGTKTLADFASDSNSPDGIALTTLSSGAADTYHITATFKTTAGNEFQKANVTFDLHIGVAVPVPAECGNPAQYGTPIFGTAGNDRLRGNNKKNLIFALEGNDVVDGGNNADCIVGGPGNDTLSGGNGEDILIDMEGNNRIGGGNSADLITAGSGDDRIDGGNGNDTILAADGANIIDGGNGNDSVTGGDDNDQMSGGNGQDLLLGSGGNDSADGGNGTDTCETEVRMHCEL